MLNRIQKRLLHHILGVRFIAGDPQCNGVQNPFVPADQLFKSLKPASLREAHELGIIWLVGHRYGQGFLNAPEGNQNSRLRPEFVTIVTFRKVEAQKGWDAGCPGRSVVAVRIPKHNPRMNIERIIRMFAGAVILLSLVLTKFHSPNWFWLTAFVGANLFQSSFTGFCPLEMILKRLGIGKTGSNCCN